ncbi:hypothetical protein MKX01_004265 [Papaver californicum]|nr:hypothetical protein MKX01_004265 [Papaver californicum]
MQASLTWPSQASSVATNTCTLLNKQSSFLPGGSLLNSKFSPRPSSKSNHYLSVTAATEIKPVEAFNLQTHISNLEKLLAEPSSHDQQRIQEQQPAIERTNSRNNYKRFLEALNFTRMWPEMKKQEYSPRNSLGSRWLEYHGSNDRIGLLDPLDENLRREIVRYGEFIQAAYRLPPLPRHIQLPDRSYKVTKSLYATSSVGLPQWFDDVTPDLGWMIQRSSWIGYVAVCDDQKEIKRMGRRDIVIALRGTSTCLEWAENVKDLLVSVNDDESEESPPSELSQERLQAKVECGFWNLYTTRATHIPSLSEYITQEVRRLVELYKGEPLSITITGHSLGAALSMHRQWLFFTFGGPRVGNRGFANRIKSNRVKVLRIVNSQDMITRVPGMLVNETLDYKLREEVKASTVLNILDNNMPWAYSHVGSELRLDSKMSPYLKPNADAACCHDLEAYLHLMDGYLASDCPFRPNAKRSLFKLLHEQGPNVKKLYTSKAKSLQKVSLEHSNNNKEVSNPLSLQSCLPSPSSYY